MDFLYVYLMAGAVIAIGVGVALRQGNNVEFIFAVWFGWPLLLIICMILMWEQKR